MRIGIGYDVHAFQEGKKLILGGVEIEYRRGLAGHSDADVLVHAVMDAILGACGQGDIGIHFPDNDIKYRDISSMILLGRVKDKMAATGYSIVNIDSVIIAQEPKIGKYFESMRGNIAGALEIDKNQVNIKATTTEGLGFCGRKEGVAAQCIALLDSV
jgi:2-C-methyl-D-erythritol 2,4-cyclodiphosphate synthase